MALQGISAHGTIIRVRPSIDDPTVAGDWSAGETIEIMELGDIAGLGTTKNEFDITSHNRNIDAYIFGVPRRELITFPVFFNRAIFSHRMLRALMADTNPATQMANGFEVEGPDGELMIFSGGVKDMTKEAPVDGAQMANVSVRATGNYILDGIEYGD